MIMCVWVDIDSPEYELALEALTLEKVDQTANMALFNDRGYIDSWVLYMDLCKANRKRIKQYKELFLKRPI